MKLALIFFSVLTSLSFWFAAQETPPIICRGKPLSIEMLELPGVKVTGVSVPLRFGGTRQPPRLGFTSDKAFHLVIKNREEFSDFWKRLTAGISWEPPLPEVDFSKKMVVVTGRGQQPSSGYFTMIDGACEVGGQVEVFVSNVDPCGPSLGIITHPADAVLLPQSDLPVVFRETQVGCSVSRGPG
jgi:hypothetical protein